MRIAYSQNRLLISPSYANAFAADAGNDSLAEAQRILNLEAREAYTFVRSSQTDESIRQLAQYVAR
jgi:hypothetical protein